MALITKSNSRQLLEYDLTTNSVIESLGKTVIPLQVATTLHRIEQAKYWANLKQKHSNPLLHVRGKDAVEEQMAGCFKSMYKPPGKELAGMVQAGCEEEVGHLLACDSLLCICTASRVDCAQRTGQSAHTVPMLRRDTIKGLLANVTAAWNLPVWGVWSCSRLFVQALLDVYTSTYGCLYILCLWEFLRGVNRQ